MPNAESATGTVTVHTRVGAEVVDTSSAAFTVTAGGDIIPSLSSITLTRIDNDVPAGWGIYVKTKSGIKITANGAAGVYGSSIVSYRYEAVGVNVTQSSNTYTQNPVTGTGSVIYKVTVTDSRGRTNSKSQAVTIYDYQAPAISSIEIIRC